MSSVGKNYAILSGRLTGDPKKAEESLSKLTPEERTLRNRSESRTKSKLRKRGYRLGDRRGNHV